MNLILRPIYLVYHGLSGLRHWSRRRLTRAGLVVAGAWLATGMMGFDTDNSVAYQAFTTLLGLLLLGAVFLPWFRGKFAATRTLPRFGTVGQPFTYHITITNHTRRQQSGLNVLENLADSRPSFRAWRELQLDDERHVRHFRLTNRRRFNPFKFADAGEAVLPVIAPEGRASTELELLPLRRGVLQFEGVTIARPDPLGLMRSFVRVTARQSVLVLPRRYPLPPLALPGAMKYQQGGVAMASNVGQSDEFVALRDYRRGDPLRHIHWRSWAKTGRPIVREFEDEFFVRHALVLDTFTERPFSPEFEEAVSVAASFACTVLTQESLLDLLFVGAEAYCFTAGRGLAHADHVLEILAAVQPSPDQTFASLEEMVINHASLVSGAILVLLDWDEARQRLVQKLQVLNLPVLVLLVRPAGQALRPDAGPMASDPERFVVLETGRVGEQLARIG